MIILDQSTKISVIIPTYNREKLLYGAINSLKDQTYNNIEIIIVDDCSNDNTEQMVMEEKLKDHRIVYVKHNKNMGAPQARNTGISKSTGEFIAFLDSDDQWLPSKLEKQMKIFQKKKKVGVVYTGIINVSNNGIRNKTTPKFNGQILNELLIRNCVGTTSTVMIRKNLLVKTGGFDSNLPSCQDWDLWVRLAQISNFDFVDESLVVFNEHDGDRITTNIKSVLDGHIRFYEKYDYLIEKLEKKTYCLSQFNLAKIIIRTGIVDQNKLIIKKGRAFLRKSFKKDSFFVKSYILYFSTFVNLGILYKLYFITKKNTSSFTSVKSKREI
ncbi:glycosyltransferase [Terrilactibacillus sp. BCM23-1]|uniref:Glycosyltransferase n=1 Tax=Terrilactibacillus tamarindi TaxID=2599694 RepID=A0A6N8CPW8_9BACI|nr:glycosyltransferase family 2 protein [Terrilactibacillus tamarindi]MTT32162.1 glycosyltransferase [Terrilactibacillus tamarindi]